MSTNVVHPTQPQSGEDVAPSGDSNFAAEKQGAADEAVQPDAADDKEEVDDYVPSDMSGLQTYEGYADVGFGKEDAPPPPPPPSYAEVATSAIEFTTAANISEEEAREALLQFVAENCCYGDKAAKQMQFDRIDPSNALHYRLETFCEKRTTCRVEVPHYPHQRVDGPHNGTPPLPWNVPVSPEREFADLEYKLPVPHTAEVRRCGVCAGRGRVRCGRCNGCGRVTCPTCSGSGRERHNSEEGIYYTTCTHCGGPGRVCCGRCDGSGRVTCGHCDGTGEMTSFIQLTVKFTNNVMDYIMEDTPMPDELVKTVSGTELFARTLPQVKPISNFPVQQINENSARLVEESRTAFPGQRQLKQRHNLRAVPVTSVAYTFKEESSTFYVYGMERKVYSPDYPHRCCWGCNIL